MKKILAVLLFASLVAVGCIRTPPQASPTPVVSVSPTQLPSTQVVEAAQACVNEFLTAPTFETYNENSKTYWFTLTDATGKYPGCSPACVVYENLTAEINYRCTGLLPAS